MFSINLVFADSQTIKKINKKYRGQDKVATVLSFYYGEDDLPCLGEVVICPAEARKQNLKLEKLVAHGFKNLLSEIPAAKLKST